LIYVADSQSTSTINPSFKQGIRIGSVKDGKVTAFITDPSAPDGGGNLLLNNPAVEPGNDIDSLSVWKDSPLKFTW
jgi:hypothetical protein